MPETDGTPLPLLNFRCMECDMAYVTQIPIPYCPMHRGKEGSWIQRPPRGFISWERFYEYQGEDD